MTKRIGTVLALAVLVVFSSSACATKKYVRASVNERVTPLENRTGELEETSRRNSQDIARLSDGVVEIRGRADRAQSQADAAMSRAEEANSRIGRTEESITDLRENMDRFELQRSTTVNFRFDSYELTPEARATLDLLANEIGDRNNYVLEIEGYADWIGTDSYNNQLTQRRADAVRRYLAENHGVSLHRMHLLGFGKLRAVADNRTREGRAQNRRVEVRLLTRAATNGATARRSSNGN